MTNIELEFGIGDYVYTICDNKLSKQKISSLTYEISMSGNKKVTYKSNGDRLVLSCAYKTIEDLMEGLLLQYEEIKEFDNKYGED